MKLLKKDFFIKGCNFCFQVPAKPARAVGSARKKDTSSSSEESDSEDEQPAKVPSQRECLVCCNPFVVVGELVLYYHIALIEPKTGAVITPKAAAAQKKQESSSEESSDSEEEKSTGVCHIRPLLNIVNVRRENVSQLCLCGSYSCYCLLLYDFTGSTQSYPSKSCGCCGIKQRRLLI